MSITNSINTFNMHVYFDNKYIKHKYNNLQSETDVQFGIIDFIAPKTLVNKQNLHFIFTVDCSGSMSDRCRDNRTKMQHILHTLKNILYFLNENCSEDSIIFVSVFAFDNKIHNIFENIKVNIDTIDFMIHKVETIKPCDNTNIELALKNALSHVDSIKKNFPLFQIHHVFMTDGQPTTGIDNQNVLKQFVDIDIFNYFVGFGIDHNAELLCTLGNVSHLSNYYFIDTLENAGLVYGEILHNILYESLNNLKIIIQNGLIYNWETNTWNDELFLPSVSSESHKTFHIISQHANDCIIKISGNVNIQNNFVPFQLNLNKSLFIFDNPDIIKYQFRQRTMELLYEVRHFKDDTETDISSNVRDNNFNGNSPTADDLANMFERRQNKFNIRNEKRKIFLKKLKKFILEMKNFIKSNNFQDDRFMNNLCDDIYIAYKTFNTAYCNMYVATRQISQGSQRSYNVTQVPHYISTPFNSSNKLDTQMLFDIDDIPNSPPRIPNSPPRIPNSPRRFLFDDFDDDNCVNIHKISNHITSPYSTPHILNTMNHISSDNGIRAPIFLYESDGCDTSDSSDNNEDE